MPSTPCTACSTGWASPTVEVVGGHIWSGGESAAGSVSLMDGAAAWHFAQVFVPDIAWYRERYVLHFRDRVIELEFPAPYLNHQQTDLWVRRSQGLRLDTTHVRAGYGEAFVRELEGFWDSVVGGAPARNPVEEAARDARLLAAVARRAIGEGVSMSDHLRSAQRARALDQLSSPRGVIAGAAIDHRDSLQAALAQAWPRSSTRAGITRLKLRVAEALAPAATMVLLDAEYAAAQALAAGAVPGETGLAVPLEGMGYGDVSRLEVTGFLEGWSPAKARRLGASGAKLLLPYRADVPDQAARQEQVVREAVAGCRDAGLALILEPIVYQREGEASGGRRALRRAGGRGRRPAGRARAGRAEAAVPGLRRRLQRAGRGLRAADPVGAAGRRRRRRRAGGPDRGRLPGRRQRLHRRSHAVRRGAGRRRDRLASGRWPSSAGRCWSGWPPPPSGWPRPGASGWGRCPQPAADWYR